MTDLQIIKELEKQLGVEFEVVKDYVLNFGYLEKLAQYVIDEQFNIIGLSISNLKIEKLDLIGKLKNLKTLFLTRNQIEDISALENLTKIEKLDLVDNHIEDISVLGNLKQINWLYLSDNQIKDISPVKDLFKKESFDYRISENPLKFPPREVTELGNEAISEYFEHSEKGTNILKEAKLIVIGEAGAGKTTFAKRVRKADAPMPKQEETTLGVEVNNWFFGGDNNTDYYTKIWDFGGQSIYHGTHQFFYSDKSLYVLLADTREQKTDFNYWLNTVEQLTGEDSPLVIILNKKQKHIWQIDEPGLKRRFGNIIRNVVTIDLSDSSGLPRLQDVVKEQILGLSHIGYTLPISWINIRKELSKLDDKFISYQQFRGICKTHGIANPKLVEIISKLFDNIGIITHFSEDFSSLKDIVFLDANWLTETVYLLLNHDIPKEKQGRITLDEIKTIWQNDEIYFEINKFIELLMKFSLIYRINGSSNYIVPEHLPMVQPYDDWMFSDDKDNYLFRYLFDNYMPKGLMAKLIVALHRFIYDNSLVWHRGVNIANTTKEPDTFAEIIETYGRENRFDIRIHGKNTKDLLQVIIYHFDNILKPFKKLTHEKLVPCNCDTCKNSDVPHFYKFRHVLNAKEKNKKQIECPINFNYAHVEELIEGINYTKIRSLLINKKYQEFKEVLSNRLSDIPYLIHKKKVTEAYFHSILHTILAENGLKPVSEEGTSDGRIDLHLTIGQTKYLFELKIDKSAKDALKQIDEKKYYTKFQRDFKEIILIGVNFSTKNRDIDDLEIRVLRNL